MTSTKPTPPKSASPAAKPYMPDLLEEHAEELEFLLGQWRDDVTSAAATPTDLAWHEERIDAHVSGLLFGGDAARPFLEALADEGGRDAWFAIALVELRAGAEDAAQRISDRIREGEPDAVSGTCDAIGATSPPAVLASLAATWRELDDSRAVAAAAALARSGMLDPRDPRLAALVTNDDPSVRRAGWLAIADASPSPDTALPMREALSDDESNVRAAAARAAACAAAPWLIDELRRVDPTENGEETPWRQSLLAVLGNVNDLPAMRSLAAEPAFGPERFAILGSFGFPAVLPVLIESMIDPQPEVAAAAGEAFHRITGFDCESDTRALAGPPGEDEFEEEFRDEVLLPDRDAAARHLADIRDALDPAARYAAGVVARLEEDGDVGDDVDLATADELALRERFAGTGTRSITGLRKLGHWSHRLRERADTRRATAERSESELGSGLVAKG